MENEKRRWGIGLIICRSTKNRPSWPGGYAGGDSVEQNIKNLYRRSFDHSPDPTERVCSGV